MSAAQVADSVNVFTRFPNGILSDFGTVFCGEDSMLSDRERHALDEIEHQLAADDPEFAWKLGAPPGHWNCWAALERTNFWTPALRLVVAVVALLTGLVCLVVEEFTAAASAWTLLVGVTLLRRWPLRT